MMQEGGQRYNHKTSNFILYGPSLSFLANAVIISVCNMNMEYGDVEKRTWSYSVVIASMYLLTETCTFLVGNYCNFRIFHCAQHSAGYTVGAQYLLIKWWLNLIQALAETMDSVAQCERSFLAGAK